MNSELINNLERYYDYARKLAGKNGEELLHSIIERIPDNLNNPPAYIRRVIWINYIDPDSDFNKAIRPTKPFEHEYHESNGHDVNDLYRILLELEIEGYQREVAVFKECYFASNKLDVSKKIDINYKTITNICNFVLNEIKERYERTD